MLLIVGYAWRKTYSMSISWNLGNSQVIVDYFVYKYVVESIYIVNDIPYSIFISFIWI
jgi:hypothetical protein